MKERIEVLYVKMVLMILLIAFVTFFVMKIFGSKPVSKVVVVERENTRKDLDKVTDTNMP